MGKDFAVPVRGVWLSTHTQCVIFATQGCLRANADAPTPSMHPKRVSSATRLNTVERARVAVELCLMFTDA